MGVGGKLMCCFSWVGGPTIIIIIIITSGALEKRKCMASEQTLFTGK